MNNQRVQITLIDLCAKAHKKELAGMNGHAVAVAGKD